MSKQRPKDTATTPSPTPTYCARCNKVVPVNSGHRLGISPSTAPLTKCLFCASIHWPMIRRSLITASIVGTILTVLNQGDTLYQNMYTSNLLWKIPLTYLVPFAVATISGLLNTRR